ncbi:hypothetical protein CS542_10770 [Pedobacter sp. IW39]|nr:hypothetical protein CS542_10770 [Pedobacter sp. IW39]
MDTVTPYSFIYWISGSWYSYTFSAAVLIGGVLVVHHAEGSPPVGEPLVLYYSRLAIIIEVALIVS